jgi:hypothetical protein
MQVSSNTGTSNANNAQTASTGAMKKAMQVQEQQIQQILDSAQKQSQQMTAQKTGMGGSLNITA